MVSIIVPVYNIERYLGKCLDSLVSQTLEDIEIIVINDGSTDQSQRLIDEYNSRYPGKFVALCKQNGGSSDARNFGIEHACGDYIGFVDGDDWVEPDMFEKLYNKALSGSFDLIVCDVNYVYNDKKCIVDTGISHDLYSPEEIRESMTRIYPVVWNKLYRRELLNSEFRFHKGIWYEDSEFLYRLYTRIRSIGVVKSCLYQYRQQLDSIMHQYNERLYQLITNFEMIFKYYEDRGLFELYHDELEFLFVRYALATFPKRLAKTRHYNLYRKGIEFAMDAVHKTFPNYHLNRYIKKCGVLELYLRFFNWIIGDVVYIFESRRR